MSRAPLMSPGHHTPRRGLTRADILGRLLFFAALAMTSPLLLWSLWLAGQFGGLVTNGAWPDCSPGDAPGIAIHLMGGDGPVSAAWPAAAQSDAPGGAVLFPLWTILFIAHVGAVTAAAARVGRRLVRRQGFASRRDLRRVLSEAAVLDRTAVVRPALMPRDGDTDLTRTVKEQRRIDPREVARFLGADAQSGQPLWLSNEFSELGEGVARFAGKTTRYVIPRVVDARGAVISTSTRLDVAEVTFDIRADKGPTLIFEPQGELPGVPRLRWSPIRGCEDQVVAMLRASGFAAGSGIGEKDVENGKWFQDQASAVIRAQLHAAALDGDATMADVLAWAENPGNSRPEKILRSHGADLWAERLTRHREGTGKSRETIQAVIGGALDCFHDPRVLHACTPPPGLQFDPRQWLAESGTLYTVGTRSAQALIAPLFAAIIEDIIYQTQRAALTAPSGRAEPPLHFIGDEITNIAPLPSLPSLMTEGGGTGIAISVFCQNSHQLQTRWGRDGGQAIEAAANARIVFGGSSDVSGLRDIQALAGQVQEVSSSSSWGGGKASVSENVRRENLLDLADLRTLQTGHALVMVGNLRPVEVRLPAWWERPDADQLHAARAAFTRRLAKGA